MAKNYEVYKTAQERAEAFHDWCVGQHKKCNDSCPLFTIARTEYEGVCGIMWLDLEAEEEKCETIEDIVADMRKGVKDWRGERVGIFDGFADRIEAAYNRVANAVKESEEKK